MLQIEGNTRWERFLSAVAGLKLRFAHAEIVKKTGYSKSVVSAYLNPEGGKEPSENFIRTFCENFEVDFELIWKGENQKAIIPDNKEAVSVKLVEPSAMQILDRLSQAFIDQAKAMADQAEGFKTQAEAFKVMGELTKSIESKMARADTQAKMETNLDEVRAIVDKLSIGQNHAIARFLQEFSDLRADKGPAKGAGKRKAGNGEGA